MESNPSFRVPKHTFKPLDHGVYPYFTYNRRRKQVFEINFIVEDVMKNIGSTTITITGETSSDSNINSDF